MDYCSLIEQDGMEKGMIKGIRLGLKLKYGSEGLCLIEEIDKIKDVLILEKIVDKIESSTSLEEIRNVYKNVFSNQPAIVTKKL